MAYSLADRWDLINGGERAKKVLFNEIGAKVFSFFFEDAIKNGFEEREGQGDMACEIVDAIQHKNHIAIEAGVGIGKSFAYIVPLLYYHSIFNTPIVISTSTIALQNQLLDDFSTIMKLINYRAEITLAKGMGHYICRHRYEKHSMKQDLPKADKDILEIISHEGHERSSWNMNIPEHIWNSINVTEYNPSICNKECTRSKLCYYYRMRSGLLQTTGIIICNHDLLTVNLHKRHSFNKEIFNSSLNLVVIDEAHNLEQKVRSSLTNSFTQNKLLSLIEQFRKRMQGSSYITQRRIEKLESDIKSLFINANTQIVKQIKTKTNDDEIERFSFERNSALLHKIKEMKDLLNGMVIELSHYETELERRRYSSVSSGISNLSEQLEEILEFLSSMCENDSNDIFWLERKRNGRTIEFFKCPNNVNETTSRLFFKDDGFTTILTSATLTNSNSGSNTDKYSYFVNTINFPVDDNVLSDPKPSPFPYDEHTMIYYTENLPHPRKNRDAFISESIKELIDLLNITSGKALLLFTSKRDLNEVHNKLLQSKLPFNLIRQNEHSSQNDVINDFKADVDSVLLATGTFWEGIDIKGVALSHLIIYKLPFPVPEPIIEYKCKNSEDSLMDVLVPETIIRSKQGIGRLIRNKDDKGIVSIVDPRMGDSSTARYKDLLWDSLPIKNRTNDKTVLKRFYDSLYSH